MWKKKINESNNKQYSYVNKLYLKKKKDSLFTSILNTIKIQ